MRLSWLLRYVDQVFDRKPTEKKVIAESHLSSPLNEIPEQGTGKFVGFPYSAMTRLHPRNVKVAVSTATWEEELSPLPLRKLKRSPSGVLHSSPTHQWEHLAERGGANSEDQSVLWTLFEPGISRITDMQKSPTFTDRSDRQLSVPQSANQCHDPSRQSTWIS